jgi:hypothetical protein
LQQRVLVKRAVFLVGGGFDEMPGAVGHVGNLGETSVLLEG